MGERCIAMEKQVRADYSEWERDSLIELIEFQRGRILRLSEEVHKLHKELPSDKPMGLVAEDASGIPERRGG